MKHHPVEYFEFLECLECLGDGILHYEDQTGGINTNGPWVDIIHTEEDCHYCDAEGHIKNTCWDDTIEGNPSGRIMKIDEQLGEKK